MDLADQKNGSASAQEPVLDGHELANVVHGICLHAQIIRWRLDRDGVSPRTREAAAAIALEAKRLLALVRPSTG